VIASPALYPECLTYDPVGDRFVIGSLIGGRLLAIERNRSVTEVALGPGGNLTAIEFDVEGGGMLVAVAGPPGGTAQLSVHSSSP
jgi:hypothetical protein